MAVLLGLDVGTSGARALAVRAQDGEVVAAAASEYGVRSPRPGWTEQDPADWWEASRRVLAQVARELDDEVLGLGLTGQMHGSVFLDERDAVIRPALLWNDQRSAAQAERIAERVGPEKLLEATGNPALTGFQAPKVLWLAEKEPEHYARVRSLLLPKDYVRLGLTGERATDPSDASGTLLLDVRARDWSDEVLDALEIPRAWLPSVHEGPEATGGLRAEVAAELGLPAGLPVAAGAGDNAAAGVGVGVTREGVLFSSVGTSGVTFAHRDRFTPDPSGRVHAFCHAVPGAFHLMGVTLSAGGALSWWRDVAREDFETLVGEAQAVAPGAEGLAFLPYLAGERTPHLDPRARGTFVGLTLRHGRAHMTRAVMEGVVFAMRDGLEVMRALGTPDEDLRAVGGGARSSLWRALQADVFARRLRRTGVDEGPAYGAALLAGVAGGAYADVADAVTRVRLREEVTEPEPERVRRYEELYAIHSALYGATKEAMHRLAASA